MAGGLLAVAYRPFHWSGLWVFLSLPVIGGVAALLAARKLAHAPRVAASLLTFAVLPTVVAMIGVLVFVVLLKVESLLAVIVILLLPVVISLAARESAMDAERRRGE